MAFSGWPAEGLDFLEDLEDNNERAWWQEHKDVYQRAVVAPMQELLSELAGDFGPGRIFRPYRDVRFSKDKTPYKTNCAAVMEKDGSVYYLSLQASGLGVATGYYMMANDQIERFRRAVDSPAGAAVEKLAASLEKKGFDIGGAALKTAPKGYPKDHPRIRFLRHKGLHCWRQWPPEPWLHTRATKKKVVDTWNMAKPLNAWLHEHVGPSTLPDDPRR